MKRRANCLNCGAVMPAGITIEGKRRNLCSRKYCFRCSPWGKHNTARIHAGRTQRFARRTCGICGGSYRYDKLKGHTWTRCNTCVVRLRHRAFKERLVMIHGGKCTVCGYSKNIDALEFHHRKPAAKEFTISRNYNRAWRSLVIESNKCDLICANCHREKHSLVP